MASKSFSSLTAGTSEVFNLDEVQPKDIYRRAKNALNCGSIIAASVHVSTPYDFLQPGLVLPRCIIILYNLKLDMTSNSNG